MTLIDTHAHLTDEAFEADREEVLRRAQDQGVSLVIEIGEAPEHWDRAVALSRARPSLVRCALGLHPYNARECTDELIARLGRALRVPEVVAVGEIGLDYARCEVPPEVQKAALRRLLAACREWDKPSIIHCRGAYPDLREIVARVFPSPPSETRFWGVVHCFSGDPDDAVFLAGRGFALGADGPVTYPKNDSLREAFRRAGPGVTVLETDSPYLPPQSRRGKRNEPSLLPEIAASLARVWGMPPDEAARTTTSNARELFRLEGSAG